MDKTTLKKIKNIVEKHSVVNKKISFGDNLDLDAITKTLKNYHKHISITEPEKDKLIKNKMPKIKVDKNNILTIKYYSYIYNDDTDFYEKYVKHVQYTISKNICKIKGIIIDLEDHYGGWMIPFIDSLSTTILNNTTLFKFQKDEDVNDKGWWNIKNKKIIYGSGKYFGREINTDVKVAVLISNKTSSSGEFCASIFKRNLSNVKIFGQVTKGYLTVNVSYKLNDKYTINVPVYYCATVDKKIHRDEKLKPDVITTKPISDAKKWILENE